MLFVLVEWAAVATAAAAADAGLAAVAAEPAIDDSGPIMFVAADVAAALAAALVSVAANAEN